MARTAEKKLLTLTEVAKRTNISMPTLQRYKKLYQDRIPSEGKGRKQRYPEEALDVFRQLKKENIGRRGRPRKTAAAKPSASAKTAKKPAKPKKKRGRPPKAKSAKAKAPKKSATSGLLTLTQISKMTGISYPTLLRYVKTNLDKIPHEGTGRARRYHKEAVAVFKDMRSKSKRGRKKKVVAAGAGKAPAAAPRRRGRPPKVIEPGELLARIKELEKTCKKLERTIARQQKQLEKPFRVVLSRK